VKGRTVGGSTWKVLCVALLERGPLRLCVPTAPLRIALHREGRGLLGGLVPWVCDGTSGSACPAGAGDRTARRPRGEPAAHVARGLGDTPEAERPLVATPWGEPACGRALARLADGTRIAWRLGRCSVTPEREVAFSAIGAR
jgi:hypothetical protein